MTQEHTPGPWSCVQKHDPASEYGSYYFEFSAGKGSSLGGFWISGIINPSDARLIAAAPDGYAFAKGLDASWSENFPLGPDAYSEGNITIGEEHAELWRQCRAFIAKAEGRE